MALNKKNRRFSFVIAIGIVIVVVVGVNIWNTRNRTEKLNMPAFTLTEKEGGLKTYESETFGMKVDFPAELFSFVNTTTGFSLTSPYHAVENYKGTPDGEFKHYFAFNFENQNLNVIDAIEQYPQLGDFMIQSFEDGTEKSFKESPDAVNVTVDSKKGYKFSFGIEGTYTRFYFIPKNENETLVIKQTDFSDFLAANVRPEPFSERAIDQEVKGIIESIRFY